MKGILLVLVAAVFTLTGVIVAAFAAGAGAGALYLLTNNAALRVIQHRCGDVLAVSVIAWFIAFFFTFCLYSFPSLRPRWMAYWNLGV